MNYRYDGDGGRVQKTEDRGQNTEDRGQKTEDRGQNTETTTYVGSLYEVESSGTIRKHIFAGANRIATIEPAHTYYSHSDHLGSSNVISDETGAQVGFTEFTPYGSISKQTGSYDPKYKFTGKELDASIGLYFYGARYYDPQMGRFITADTIVQAPYDPQSLNRYSYCKNNPINYVDPSGNLWFLAPLLIAAIKGALVGAIIGGIVAAATGQNIMQGMATGAVSGAIFGGIGSLGLQGAAHTLAHTMGGAASGAINAKITGGDVGMNALIGGLSAGVSERLGNFGPLRDVVGKGMGVFAGNLLRRAFIGSVIGGSVAAATGGKFGYGARQGAMTSAIAYTANDWMHEGAEYVKKQVQEANSLRGK